MAESFDGDTVAERVTEKEAFKLGFSSPEVESAVAGTDLLACNLLAWACMSSLERIFWLYFERRLLFSALTPRL